MKKWAIKGKEFIKDKRKLAIVGVVLIAILVAFTLPSFAALTPIKSIEVESSKLSYTGNDPGAWKVTKSAKWIEKGKARITIDIDTKLKTNDNVRDVILVLDISGSMEGDKLSRVKEDTLYLINKLIPEGSKVALITFDTSSQILSDFTADIDLLTTKINDLTATGTTNYYQALINVDNILKNYTYSADRGCIALFLTDGYPCEDIPNQIAQYGYLKVQYPYLTINGIQYEMGDTILQPIIEVSDHQYIASLETLNIFLLKATVNPVTYSDLEIADYINSDYFIIENISSINNNADKVNLQDNKVVWNLDAAASGNKYTLTIDIKLKDEFLGKGGIYSTNEKLEVKAQIEETIDNIISTKTPILADNYKVIYETNAPEGCTVTNVPAARNVSVFDAVSMLDTVPVCEGYNFKGWKLITEGVTKANDDYFIMPEKDVTVRAIWGKSSVTKSMEGIVSVRGSLYKALQDEATSGGVAKEYIGSHQDSFSGVGDKKIYYYSASNPVNAATVNNKNNVIFAGQCWQMIRTTDTGGVKMIYNGEAEDGKCLDTRGTHVGYFGSTTQNLNGNYYYGTDYKYDASTKKFSLGGTLTQATWNSTTYPSLIGKYTCASTNRVGTCSTLYYVERYSDASSAYVLILDASSHYSVFGVQRFNVDYNSLAYVGYMYNTIYKYSPMLNSSSGKLVGTTDNRWLFGNDVEYKNGYYTLVNTQRFDLSSDYNKLSNNHYTCFSKYGSCTTVYYIYYTNSSASYYIELANGTKIEKALVEMLSADNVNSKNSVMKSAVEAWYEKYLKDYTKYLEDTVYCNDRSIYQLGGWKSNGGNIGDYLEFKEYNEYNLSCNNTTDRFSTLNEKAKLKYPVGVMSTSELELFGLYTRKTGQYYWSSSPRYFRNGSAIGFYIESDGSLGNERIDTAYGVRPAISLAPNTYYSDGDGSMENPYVVELK